MTYQNLAVGIALATWLVGCNAERDVEVTGTVTAPSNIAVGDRVVVDIIDVVGDGGDTQQLLAFTTELMSTRDFKETVALEGDQVLIRAIDDRDGDGKCTAGEAWGETHAAISQGKAQATTLMLSATACPRD